MPESSIRQDATIRCFNCSEEFDIEQYLFVDGVNEPTLSDQIRDMKLNQHMCPHCKSGAFMPHPLIYFDSRSSEIIYNLDEKYIEGDHRTRVPEVVDRMRQSFNKIMQDQARVILPSYNEICLIGGPLALKHLLVNLDDQRPMYYGKTLSIYPQLMGLISFIPQPKLFLDEVFDLEPFKGPSLTSETCCGSLTTVQLQNGSRPSDSIWTSMKDALREDGHPCSIARQRGFAYEHGLPGVAEVLLFIGQDLLLPVVLSVLSAKIWEYLQKRKKESPRHIAPSSSPCPSHTLRSRFADLASISLSAEGSTIRDQYPLHWNRGDNSVPWLL